MECTKSLRRRIILTICEGGPSAQIFCATENVKTKKITLSKIKFRNLCHSIDLVSTSFSQQMTTIMIATLFEAKKLFKFKLCINDKVACLTNHLMIFIFITSDYTLFAINLYSTTTVIFVLITFHILFFFVFRS